MVNLIKSTYLPQKYTVWALLLVALLTPFVLTTPVRAQSIDDGLVGYWPFDADNPAIDQAGFGNNATLGSGLQLTTAVAPTAFANSRALLSTPNPNSYASAPGHGIDNLTNYTIAFWLRANGAAQAVGDVLALGNRLVIQDRVLQQQQHVLSIRFPLRIFPYPVEAVFVPNAWVHVVIAIQGNETRIYFNGELAQQETYLANSSGDPGHGVRFSSPTAPLDGILDDVRIYDRVLNASEIAALPYNCNNVQGIPVSECQALVNLFRDTGGIQWTMHTNWLQNNTPCTWFGLLCNNGHLFALTLPQNNLHGLLPITLGDLKALVVLQLPNNQLTDALPVELGNLSQLQTLDLYGNQLNGQIPFTLGKLAQLQTLRLYNNQLRGPIPPQLTNLSKLLTLDLGYNMLTAVDPNLINFLNHQQPNWSATQTVPPTNLHATVLSSSSVALTWTPIAYTTDGGHYEVLSTTLASGLYSPVGQTATISTTDFLVTGLAAGQSYAFLVRTFVPKHGLQQNDLLSDSTDPVAVTLTGNRPPVAANDSYPTQQEMPLTVDAAHGLLANDRDPDGDQLTIGSISSVNPGSQFALNPDGSFTYTPAPGFVGTETFTYQATDGQSLSNPATVAFVVTAQPPTATITIVLDVQPDSKTNFNFTGALGAFKLDDITPQDRDSFGNSKSFSVAAGSYTVTEAVPNGWVNANISCNPPANTVADLVRNQIVINVAAGANVTCTFVTQRAGKIIAGKYEDRNQDQRREKNEPWLNGWRMELYSGPGALMSGQNTSGEGRTVFANLRPGNYTVCEVVQPGWFNITPHLLTAAFHQPCYSVTVEAGKAVWSRFGNSNTAPVSAAGADDFLDVIICDLPPTDDAGVETAAERDPWEEEEVANNVLFLPLVAR